jgi:CheY-like chemotaxis protein
MKKLRVLIVEDDAWIAMYLADMLEEMGYAVIATEGTEEGAVAAAAHHRPDLMIVDAGLREGDGVTAVSRILRIGFVPHVFVSGDTLDGQPLDRRAVVVRKPFLEPDLLRAIQKALDAPD